MRDVVVFGAVAALFMAMSIAFTVVKYQTCREEGLSASYCFFFITR